MRSDYQTPPHGPENRAILGCSPVIATAASRIMDELTRGDCATEDLCLAAGYSRATIHRSIRWLRARGVRVRFSRRSWTWSLGLSAPVLHSYTLADAVRSGLLTRAEATVMALEIGGRDG